MREILVGTIVLGSLLPSHLSAQRSSLTARGGGPVHFAGSTVVPPLRGVVPPLGSTHTGVRFFNARQNRFRAGHQGGSQFGYPFWGYGDWGYGDFYGGDYLNGYQAQAQPSVVVVAPQMAMPPLLPPPPPPRPEIRDYTWPDSSSSSTPGAFSIVTKDHRIESAIAVSAQDGELLYVTPDGSKKRISISSVDRAATNQRNAEKHLTLSIP